MIGGNLVQYLAATDRLHGESGVELRSVSARLLMGAPPFSRQVLKVNDGSCPEKPVDLRKYIKRTRNGNKWLCLQKELGTPEKENRNLDPIAAK